MREESANNATYRKPVAVRISPPQQPGAPFAYIINEIDRKVQLHVSAKGKPILNESPFCHFVTCETIPTQKRGLGFSLYRRTSNACCITENKIP